MKKRVGIFVDVTAPSLSGCLQDLTVVHFCASAVDVTIEAKFSRAVLDNTVLPRIHVHALI